MTAKQDEVAIGFDPLAWMDDEADEKEGVEAEKSTTSEKEIVEEEKPVVEEKTTIESDAEVETTVAEPTVEQINDAEDDAKIILDATLNIQNVSKLYEQMRVQLEGQERIEIDASSVSSVDTATLQLLVVLKQTAIKLHKEVIIDFPSDDFIEAADLLGLSEMLEVDQAAAGFF
jgi:ABC-type transporter Mla MlaB component